MDLLTIICDIIKNELSLSSGQVMVYNQEIEPPTTKGLYIVVGYLTGKAIGNSANVKDEDTGISEDQAVTMLEVIQLDIMSIDDSARQQKEQVIMALNSDYAQKIMETNRIKIFKIPGQFNDVSGVEGHGILTRFVMPITIMAVYPKNKVVDYFDDDLLDIIKKYFAKKNIPNFNIGDVQILINGKYNN